MAATQDSVNQVAGRVLNLEQQLAVIQNTVTQHGQDLRDARTYVDTRFAEIVERFEKIERAKSRESIIDTRLLNKPKEFGGTQEEWKDWSWKFVGYTGALSVAMKDYMEAAVNSDAILMLTAMDSDMKQKALELYYIFIMLCSGEAKIKIQNVENGNGLEVWRQFCLEWDPKERGRYGSMLTSILNTRFDHRIYPQLQAWKTKIQKYEEVSSEKVTDNIRVSVVMANCDFEKISDHLALNAARLDTYVKLEKEIRDVTMAGKKWAESDDMDVDAIKGGRGRGRRGYDWTKGRGRGRGDDWKGGKSDKGKGKTDKDKGKDQDRGRGRGRGGNDRGRGAGGRGKGAGTEACNTR